MIYTILWEKITCEQMFKSGIKGADLESKYIDV